MFEAVIAEIYKEDKGAAAYLMESNPECWSRAFFKFHSCCDSVENNMCEVFNGVLVDARRKPLISMLEDIRVYNMVRARRKREIHMMWDDQICPRIRKKLDINKENYIWWLVDYSGNYKFEVKKEGEGYVVDMKRNTCTCNMWQLSGIPCCHAVAAIYYQELEPDNFVAHWYKVDQSIKAYQVCVEAVNGETLWPKSTAAEMLPPLARRMPGRPKRARRKTIHEEPRNGVSRVGRLMTCSNCKQPGHNKKSCRNPRVNGTTRRQAEPRPRKRKEKPPPGYGVHTFEDGTQYIMLPGWKRGKYFDPRLVQASQPYTDERILASQVSTQASRISFEDYYSGNQPSETTAQPSIGATVPCVASSSGGNPASTRSGNATKGRRTANAPTSGANVGVKTGNVGASATIVGARTGTSGAKTGNGGARAGNGGTNGITNGGTNGITTGGARAGNGGARAGNSSANGTAIAPIGPPKPQSKPPPKPKTKTPSLPISQRTNVGAAVETSTGTNTRSKTLGTVRRVWRR